MAFTLNETFASWPALTVTVFAPPSTVTGLPVSEMLPPFTAIVPPEMLIEPPVISVVGPVSTSTPLPVIAVKGAVAVIAAPPFMLITPAA